MLQVKVRAFSPTLSSVSWNAPFSTRPALGVVGPWSPTTSIAVITGAAHDMS